MVNCFKPRLVRKMINFKNWIASFVPICKFRYQTKAASFKVTIWYQIKLALYVPTYREHHQANQIIDKARFETALPSYTLMSKLHPSLPQDEQHNISLQSLWLWRDCIITDYSSLAIEASLLKATLLCL